MGNIQNNNPPPLKRTPNKTMKHLLTILSIFLLSSPLFVEIVKSNQNMKEIQVMYIIKIIGILVLSWLILLSFYHQIKTEILYKEDQERLKRSRIIFGQLIVMDIIFFRMHILFSYFIVRMQNYKHPPKIPPSKIFKY